MDHALDVIYLGDIGLDEDGLSSRGLDPLDHLLAQRLSSTHSHRLCAFLGEKDGGCASDA